MGEPGLKFGVVAWNQYSDWSALREAGVAADRLGYDSLWTWDHLYPITGDPRGSIFEGFMTLASWAEATEGITIGLMVAANTFRNPAHLVKMVTTLDHISGGRAVLGIGGAWYETEHTAFGIDFGSGFGERLDRLDEAAELIRGMLRGEEPSARGRFYHAQQVRNDPPPVQEKLPILIGGGGEKKTLATVARYADAWEIGGTVEMVRHKDEVLRRWCEEVGRDESEIERVLGPGVFVIRNRVEDARRAAAEIGARNGGWRGPQVVGPPEVIAEHVAPYLEFGFRHLDFDLPAPYDRETLERLIGEVKPLLARA
jgi:alkanesulfonate monooxygenase SsuD/methylene tetrahydromethanopterin reductase-like flavin-dependent oxidoreductase (luciferase family)